MKLCAMLMVVLSLSVKDSYQKKKVCFQVPAPAPDIRASCALVIQLVGDPSTFINRPGDKAAVESIAVEVFTKHRILSKDKSKTIAGNDKILIWR